MKTREQAARAGEDIKETAEQTKGTLSTLFEKGKETATSLMDKARSATGLAGDKVERAIDGQTAAADMSDVRKALHQRYEKTTAVDTRSAEEVLKARYKPIDNQDHTVLRGL